MNNIIIGIMTAATLMSAQALSAKDLRLGDFQSTTHIVSVEGTQKWMKEVTAATGGTLTFQHFPAEQAAKAKELLDAVKNGVLDAALIGPIYNADVLPLNSVVGLPGFFTTAAQGTAALQKMEAQGPLRDELVNYGVVPIFAFVLPPYQVLSKDKRLGMPSDWKGLNIRTAGATQAMIAKNLGGAGISIDGPEVYTAVETGRLDAVLFPLPSVPGYNLQEVVKHISTNGSFGGYSFVLVVNNSVYEGLSQDEKAAMTKIGTEIAAHVAKAQDDSVGELTTAWAKKGIDIYQLTPEEAGAINKDVAGAQSEWLTRVGKRNPSAKDVLASYSELVK